MRAGEKDVSKSNAGLGLGAFICRARRRFFAAVQPSFFLPGLKFLGDWGTGVKVSGMRGQELFNA